MRWSPLLRAALAACCVLAFAAHAQSRSEIVQAAQQMWRDAANQGVDFSSGPCLGTVGDDWAVDVVHVPRSPVDDQPDNQCAAYRRGQVHHFVELDVNGNVVRVQ